MCGSWFRFDSVKYRNIRIQKIRVLDDVGFDIVTDAEKNQKNSKIEDGR